MVKTKSNKPAAGRSWLTPLYDFGVRVTMPERMIRDRLVRLVDPKPQERILEFEFGIGSNLVETAGFSDVRELDIVNTSVGTFRFLRAGVES